MMSVDEEGLLDSDRPPTERRDADSAKTSRDAPADRCSSERRPVDLSRGRLTVVRKRDRDAPAAGGPVGLLAALRGGGCRAERGERCRAVELAASTCGGG